MVRHLFQESRISVEHSPLGLSHDIEHTVVQQHFHIDGPRKVQMIESHIWHQKQANHIRQTASQLLNILNGSQPIVGRIMQCHRSRRIVQIVRRRREAAVVVAVGDATVIKFAEVTATHQLSVVHQIIGGRAGWSMAGDHWNHGGVQLIRIRAGQQKQEIRAQSLDKGIVDANDIRAKREHVIVGQEFVHAQRTGGQLNIGSNRSVSYTS